MHGNLACPRLRKRRCIVVRELVQNGVLLTENDSVAVAAKAVIEGRNREVTLPLLFTCRGVFEEPWTIMTLDALQQTV